jgi:hypothetical protein
MLNCNNELTAIAYREISNNPQAELNIFNSIKYALEGIRQDADNIINTVYHYFSDIEDGRTLQQKRLDIGRNAQNYFDKFDSVRLRAVGVNEFKEGGRYYNKANKNNNYQFDSSYGFQLIIEGSRNGQIDYIGSFNIPQYASKSNANITLSKMLHDYVATNHANNMYNGIPVNKTLLKAISEMRPARIHAEPEEVLEEGVSPAEFTLRNMLDQYGTDKKYVFSSVYILTDTMQFDRPIDEDNIGRPFVFYSQYGSDMDINKMVENNHKDLKMIFLDTKKKYSTVEELYNDVTQVEQEGEVESYNYFLSDYQRKKILNAMVGAGFLKLKLQSEVFDELTFDSLNSINESIDTKRMIQMIGKMTNEQLAATNKIIEQQLPNGILFNPTIKTDPAFKTKAFARALMNDSDYDSLLIKHLKKDFSLLPSIAYNFKDSPMYENGAYNFSRLFEQEPAIEVTPKSSVIEVKASLKAENMTMADLGSDDVFKAEMKLFGIEPDDIRSAFVNMTQMSYLYDGDLDSYIKDVIKNNGKC